MTVRHRATAVLLAALLLGGSACMAGSDAESEDGTGITGGGGDEEGEGEGEGGYGGGEEGEEEGD